MELRAERAAASPSGGVPDAFEERALLREAQAGSTAARAALLRAFRRRVEPFVRQQAYRGVSPDDLLQEGYMGLLEALAHFDLDREVRFWTYAKWWVRARITAYAVRNRRIVTSSGRSYRRVQGRLLGAEAKVRQQNGDPEPERGAIAQELGIPESELERVAPLLRGRDEPYDDAHGLAATDDGSPEARVAEDEREGLRNSVLRAGLQVLDRREREIVEARHLQQEPLTLVELGRRMGISRERVRQLEVRALHKMRRVMESRVAVDDVRALAS